MAGKIVNGIKTTLLNQQRTWWNGLTLRLYQNNRTPAETDVASDYTEATFPGYAAQALNDFGTPFLNGANKAQMQSGLHTFTSTGSSPSNTIYGYYVTDSGGNLVGAELRAAGPVTINASGQQYNVIVNTTDTGE